MHLHLLLRSVLEEACGIDNLDVYAKVLEKGKQSVLQKHSKDSKEAPHWHEELASDSEAFVCSPASYA